MTLTLLHTAEIHRTTFDTLRDRIAPDVALTHVVRPKWLTRAQGGISAELASAISGVVSGADGPVICTCTTLGPTAAAAGAIRVDAPMMQKAAEIGGPILMAFAVNSTWEPSLALLEKALEVADTPAKVLPLPLTQYWPLFQAGETEAFAAVIAGEIRQAVIAHPEVACVVLAQVSMAGAAPLLGDLDVPVLASPELALRAAFETPADTAPGQ